MKVAILCVIILSAATASAETTIIEYPDHYYIESVDIPAEKPAPSQEISVPPAEETPVVNRDSSVLSATPRPMTIFNNAPQPVNPAERRAAMENEIQRLQRERSELMTQKEGENSDQAASRQQAADGKLRKINKISSELLKISVQGY
jgi:hypothetical protein